MSFCPKCKAEYINGRIECADCNIPLVESLEEISNVTMVETDSDTEEAVNPITGNNWDEDTLKVTDDGEDSTTPAHTHAFVSKKEKFKDYESTGYTFITVGLIGFVITTLNLFGILKLFRTSGASAVLFYTVMYGMFVIFTFVGINSFINASRIKKEAVEEDQFLSELNTFLEDAISVETFQTISSEKNSEEFYFGCTQLIRQIIREQYPEIDASLLDKVADDTFEKYFS